MLVFTGKQSSGCTRNISRMFERFENYKKNMEKLEKMKREHVNQINYKEINGKWEKTETVKPGAGKLWYINNTRFVGR